MMAGEQEQEFLRSSPLLTGVHQRQLPAGGQAAPGGQLTQLFAHLLSPGAGHSLLQPATDNQALHQYKVCI